MNMEVERLCPLSASNSRRELSKASNIFISCFGYEIAAVKTPDKESAALTSF